MAASPTSPLLWHPALRHIKKLIKNVEYNFLGTSWAFVECGDGTAYWLHVKSETVVPSSRNAGIPDVKKKPQSVKALAAFGTRKEK